MLHTCHGCGVEKEYPGPGLVRRRGVYVCGSCLNTGMSPAELERNRAAFTEARINASTNIRRAFASAAAEAEAIKRERRNAEFAAGLISRQTALDAAVDAAVASALANAAVVANAAANTMVNAAAVVSAGSTGSAGSADKTTRPGPEDPEALNKVSHLLSSSVNVGEVSLDDLFSDDCIFDDDDFDNR